MFLSNQPSLRETIVYVLARQGASTPKAIQAHIVKRYRSCSLQAVYLELAQLLEAGVVLKAKGRFDLSLAWICKLSRFSGDLTDLHFARPSALFEIPEVGEKIKLDFGDARLADIFWMQCISKLLYSSKSKRMFQWVPHPWHRLIIDQASRGFENVIRHVRARDYVIVGGATYLDREAFKSWASDVFVYSTALGPFDKERTLYLTVIDDFLITQRYPLRFIKEVDSYFQRVRSAKDVKYSDIFVLFSQKTNVALTLEHSPAKAEKARKKFLRFFGEKAQ